MNTITLLSMMVIAGGICVFVLIVANIFHGNRKPDRQDPNSRGRGRIVRPYRLAESLPDDWFCANPKCFARNPGHARYCRMCCNPGPRFHPEA